MADYLSPDWIKIENEMLQILMKMQSKWANALQAAHRCERMQIENPHVCVVSLDAALEEAQELEKLIKMYIETLKKMRDMFRSE